MQQDTCGHQGILPALLFRQWHSANCLDSMDMWSSASYSACCALFRRGPVIEFCSVCAHEKTLAAVRHLWRRVLYLSTTQGSAHCRRRMGALTRELSWHMCRRASGISIQTTRWLLGTPSPKARYPARHIGIKASGTKIPSMGSVP